MEKKLKITKIVGLFLSFAVVFCFAIRSNVVIVAGNNDVKEIESSCVLEEFYDEQELELKVLVKTKEHQLEKKKEFASCKKNNQFEKRPKKEAPVVLTAKDYFEMLPENVRNAFYNNGWSYEQVDYNFGEPYGISKSIVALTIYGENKIFLSTKKGGSKAILHEVGHAITRIESTNSHPGWYSPEFKELWENHYLEWQANYGEHMDNYNNPNEAYAQCVEIYVLKPKCLDEDTRNFIANELAAY